MLPVGSKAPDFELRAHDGSTVKLSSILKRSNVVLYFYPKDGTPGCTKEACLFRDSFDEIVNRNAAILGVSPDDIGSHAEFRQKHNLPFTLLSDPDKRVAKMYGALGFLGQVRRVTYVIDRQGIIKHVYASPMPGRHVKEVIKVLSTLESS